jgi:spermidine synthase
MKQPLWKKFLSHFFSFSIEKTESAYSGPLEIIYSRGRYGLCTQNAMYSFEDLYLNFRESFKIVDLKKYKIQKVLMLGAGLCSVPLIIEKKQGLKLKYRAVEIDPKIIAFSKKYTLSQLQSEIALICANALDFVKNDEDNYELIIVDLFIDDIVPDTFEQKEFLLSLKKLLSPAGLLMFNRMANNEAALKKTENFFNKDFKAVFPEAKMLEIFSNKMLVNQLK